MPAPLSPASLPDDRANLPGNIVRGGSPVPEIARGDVLSRSADAAPPDAVADSAQLPGSNTDARVAGMAKLAALDAILAPGHPPHAVAPARVGVLLANLGTPAAPTTKAIRSYLREFLSDPRVVDTHPVFWWLLLNLAILPRRPQRLVARYAALWTPDGAPLLAIGRQQARALATELVRRLPGVESATLVPNRFDAAAKVATPEKTDAIASAVAIPAGSAAVPVALAMRYGNPSVAEALRELEAAGARRIVVLPLFPQYSATTTAAVFDALYDALKLRRWPPEVRTVNSYHDHPAYIAALADSVRAHRAAPTPTCDEGKVPVATDGANRRHLLFSFHGIPQRYFALGDPYPCHCLKTARLVATALGLGDEEWSVAFQSRFGREPWLRPYADEHLRALAADDVTSLDVLAPGFAADCLETLEEIAVEYAELFAHASGGRGRLHYVPALNATDAHIRALADVVLPLLV